MFISGRSFRLFSKPYFQNCKAYDLFLLIVVAFLPIIMPEGKIVNKYSFVLYLCPLVTGILAFALPQCSAQSLEHKRHSGNICGMNWEDMFFTNEDSETRDKMTYVSGSSVLVEVISS